MDMQGHAWTRHYYRSTWYSVSMTKTTVMFDEQDDRNARRAAAMRAKWADPGWRAQTVAAQTLGQRDRRARDGTDKEFRGKTGRRDPETGKLYFPLRDYERMSASEQVAFNALHSRGLILFGPSLEEQP